MSYVGRPLPTPPDYSSKPPPSRPPPSPPSSPVSSRWQNAEPKGDEFAKLINEEFSISIPRNLSDQDKMVLKNLYTISRTLKEDKHIDKIFEKITVLEKQKNVQTYFENNPKLKQIFKKLLKDTKIAKAVKAIKSIKVGYDKTENKDQFHQYVKNFFKMNENFKEVKDEPAVIKACMELPSKLKPPPSRKQSLT
jgi:hypothetical protein